jgi:hypothetical protein
MVQARHHPPASRFGEHRTATDELEREAALRDSDLTDSMISCCRKRQAPKVLRSHWRRQHRAGAGSFCVAIFAMRVWPFHFRFALFSCHARLLSVRAPNRGRASDAFLRP